MTTEKITYGLATSIVFDMSKENALFQRDKDAYIHYMIEKADEALPLGIGFEHLQAAMEAPDHIDIVLISRNNPITARRALITLEKEGIVPPRMLFTNGGSPVPYLKAYDINYFRTQHQSDSLEAHRTGILSPLYEAGDPSSSLFIAADKQGLAKSLKPEFNGKTVHHMIFDLDGVVFGSECEKFFQDHGLAAYYASEQEKKNEPISPGPAFALLKKASEINNKYSGDHRPFKLSVVTARGHYPAIRAIETLHHWGIDINGETHFLGGRDKQPILEIMRQRDMAAKIATEFLDDQPKNAKKGREAGILTGRVPSELFFEATKE